jgi:amidase
VFHGVPIGIKDLNLARGTFSRMGSRAYRYFYSPIDDVTTSALRKAGFIILGKLATPEFGVLPITEPDIHEPTKNPWNTELSPGGSSGGSAAAVAAGLLPIAQGSDGAGSIRIPASICGLFGHKPSRGAIPNAFPAVDRLGIAECGPLARGVDDAAAMLDALAGRLHPATTARAESFFAEAHRPPRGLIVKFTTSSPLGACPKETVDAVLAVVKRLEAFGHHVEEGERVVGELDEYLPIWQRQVANIPSLSESILQPVTRWMRKQGRLHTAARVRKLHEELSGRITTWFGNADLCVTPTVPAPTPRIGQWNGLSPEETFRQAATLGPFTALFNASGQPAASVPAGITADGSPIGVQIVGKRGADGIVLAVAKQLEAELRWTERHVRGSYA